ncbi:MAG: hypothetical protein ABIR37_00620 [Candidatus Saccharimonadales bacterium]
MEEQTNNVGGQSMGMANSGPGPVQNDHVPQPFFGAPGAPAPANLDAQNQPPANHAAPHTAGQPGGQQLVSASDQNNNDVSNTTTPSNADDSDLIEKEWVEKAKAIVEKTRRDPFQQSQELNRFKNEYLQKRYGKNVGSDGE